MFKTLAKRLLVFFFVFSFLSAACLAQFTDVSSSDPEYNAVKFLAKEKIITVGPIRQFKPNAYINRYEMAVLLDRMFKKIFPRQVPLASNSTMQRYFRDVSPRSFSYNSIRALYKIGVISKPSGRRFRGRKSVSRYEFYTAFAKMLNKASLLKAAEVSLADQTMYVDVPVYHWAYHSIFQLVKNGFLPGEGFFEGDGRVSRKEAALSLYAAIKKLGKVEIRGDAVGAIADTAAVKMYSDVPRSSSAYNDIAELCEAKILTAGPGKKFNGSKLTNRYQSIDLLGKMLEKILSGQTELKRASYNLGYKDVSVLSPSYSSIQKLIELGVLPAGNETEYFFGWKRINRYQMISIFFKPLEDLLEGTLKFKKADASKMYGDIPSGNFAYPTIQKLIWLGMLDGGAGNKFKGSTMVTRYEMAVFVSKLLKSVYYKIAEKEIVAAPAYLDYGVDFSLITTLSLAQVSNAKTGGGDLLNANATQIAELAFNRQLNKEIGGHLSLRTTYGFGQLAAVAPAFYQGYLIWARSPFISQTGRQIYFKSYDPFGNSLFVDTFSDMILVEARNSLGSAVATVNKLISLGNDVSFDSNAATLLVKPKVNLPIPFEFAVGAGIINDPVDPTGVAQLNTRITQLYLGTRMSLMSNLQFNAEAATVGFTNKDLILPFIGFSGDEDLNAYQAAFTYFSSDMSQQYSLGYQNIGDDFYMAQMIDPAVRVGGGQGTYSWLFKYLNYLTSREYVSLNLENIYADSVNTSNRISLLYSNRIFSRAYLLGTLARLDDKVAPDNSSWTLTGRLSVYF